MLRLQMCVRRSDPLPVSQRIFATERPTVPKPNKATRIDELCAEVGFAGFEGGSGMVFERKMNSLSYVGCGFRETGNGLLLAVRWRYGRHRDPKPHQSW